MKKVIFSILLLINIISCGQHNDFGPGYQFSLFESTPIRELAYAVEQEDSAKILNLIKTGKYDINFIEPKYHTTLLWLAVGNDKYTSAKILLENKANPNIKDSWGYSPILAACQFSELRNHSLEMVRLLIKYGASVNDSLPQVNGKDTVDYIVPLSFSTSNLECTKILLENKANLYICCDNNYSVWYSIFLNGYENIFVAKYLIIDRKMPIPNPIAVSTIKKIPQDIYFFLNHYDSHGDPKKGKAKQEILAYLKKIDFPNKQVYQTDAN